MGDGDRAAEEGPESRRLRSEGSLEAHGGLVGGGGGAVGLGMGSHCSHPPVSLWDGCVRLADIGIGKDTEVSIYCGLGS